MLAVGRPEMRLENGVDADQPLHGLVGRLRLLDRVHERGDRGVGRLGLLGVGAELGQPPAERVAVLSQIPDVTPHQELRGQLGGERDPAAEGAHRALHDVAVVPQETGGMLGAEGSFEGLRHER